MTLKYTELLIHSIIHSCAVLQSYCSFFLLVLENKQARPFMSSQLFTFHPCIKASSSFVICLASFSSLHISAYLFSIFSKIATLLPPLFPILVIPKMCPQISSVTVIWQLVRKANSQDHLRSTELETEAGPQQFCVLTNP